MKAPFAEAAVETAPSSHARPQRMVASTTAGATGFGAGRGASTALVPVIDQRQLPTFIPQPDIPAPIPRTHFPRLFGLREGAGNGCGEWVREHGTG
jgi:hypothetical protein